jgi:hypothetical protein
MTSSAIGSQEKLQRHDICAGFWEISRSSLESEFQEGNFRQREQLEPRSEV